MSCIGDEYDHDYLSIPPPRRSVSSRRGTTTSAHIRLRHSALRPEAASHGSMSRMTAWPSSATKPTPPTFLSRFAHLTSPHLTLPDSRATGLLQLVDTAYATCTHLCMCERERERVWWWRRRWFPSESNILFVNQPTPFPCKHDPHRICRFFTLFSSCLFCFDTSPHLGCAWGFVVIAHTPQSDDHGGRLRDHGRASVGHVILHDFADRVSRFFFVFCSVYDLWFLFSFLSFFFIFCSFLFFSLPLPPIPSSPHVIFFSVSGRLPSGPTDHVFGEDKLWLRLWLRWRLRWWS